MRLPAGVESRGGEGAGDDRADQRNARQPLDVYAGEVDSLLDYRTRRVVDRHAAGKARLWAGSRRSGRSDLSGRSAFHLHDVGSRRGDCQPVGDDAADHVRDVLLRNDLRADERTDYSDRVDARMGANDHAVSSAPLFYCDHALRLSQGRRSLRTVGRLRSVSCLRCHFQYAGRIDLQKTGLVKVKCDVAVRYKIVL